MIVCYLKGDYRVSDIQASKQAENRLTGRYSSQLDYSYKEDMYDEYLLGGGLTKEDFNKFKTMDIKDAIDIYKEIIKGRSIAEDRKELWNVDEVYFLNYEKDEVVLRKGKKVFYLEGKDFSDPEIVDISKDKLDL